MTLAEVYLAYRKAKTEAFYDSNCPYGFKFALFEEDLVAQLDNIFTLVNAEAHPWADDESFIGKVAVIPRGIEKETEKADSHFFESDPSLNWIRTAEGKEPGNRPRATLRKVIHADVKYLVLTAIWVLKVAEKFERCLRPECVYGNLLRRRFVPNFPAKRPTFGPVNWDSHSIFRSYSHQYGLWRKESIAASRVDLEAGKQILVICLDISSFYDRIDPTFLNSEEYLNSLGVELTEFESRFTQAIVKSFSTWYAVAGVSDLVGVPIGLPASAVIANLVLGELDSAMVEGLRPTFYGRYVDDIYLSVITDRTFSNGFEATAWLAEQVSILNYDAAKRELEARLLLSQGTQISFGAKKQRIFHLRGKSGLDVIQPIEAHIREQSSEHRLLPTIPDDEAGMAARALLVSQDATKRVSVMRDADAMTLQRAGFADLLSNFERYERHLFPSDWEDKRSEFYGLVQRHILNPQGLFEFHRYISRIVGLMASARDWEDILQLLDSLASVKMMIGQTCQVDENELGALFENIARRIELAVLMAIPSAGADDYSHLRRAIRRIRKLGEVEIKDPSDSILKSSSEKLVRSDWSRKPYYKLLFSHYESGSGSVPTLEKSVSYALRLGEIFHLFRHMEGQPQLSLTNWLAVVFSTRPLPISHITEKISHEMCVNKLFDYVLAIRGIRLPKWARPMPYLDDGNLKPESIAGIMVGPLRARNVLVGVSSFETSDIDWKYSVRGTPVLDRERLERFTNFLNSILRCSPRPEIIVLPELCLPRSLSSEVSYWLNRNGVSLVSGLEYGTPARYHKQRLNQVLISMSLAQGYGPLSFLQRKIAPAWEESAELRRIADVHLAPPAPGSEKLPIYSLNGFLFGVLICSDLTNVANRARFQGKIDALFVPEWNKDINSFASLVEASALDIHAFIIQSNNRRYGDSRIRAPFKKEFMRDVVRLKGGVHDYFIVGEIDLDSLREFQSDTFPDTSEGAAFKPFPIGFEISAIRRKRRP